MKDANILLPLNLDMSNVQDLRSSPWTDELAIIRIEAKGDCLFQSVAEMCRYIDGTPDWSRDHSKLRERVYEKLKEFKENEEFINDLKSSVADRLKVKTGIEKLAHDITDKEIDDYIEAMSHQYEFGGNIEVAAISELLDIPIALYDRESNGFRPGVGTERIKLIRENAAQDREWFDPSHSEVNHFNLVVDKELAEKILEENGFSKQDGAYVHQDYDDEVDSESKEEHISIEDKVKSSKDKNSKMYDLYSESSAELKSDDASDEKDLCAKIENWRVSYPVFIVNTIARVETEQAFSYDSSDEDIDGSFTEQDFESPPFRVNTENLGKLRKTEVSYKSYFVSESKQFPINNSEVGKFLSKLQQHGFTTKEENNLSKIKTSILLNKPCSLSSRKNQALYDELAKAGANSDYIPEYRCIGYFWDYSWERRQNLPESKDEDQKQNEWRSVDYKTVRSFYKQLKRRDKDKAKKFIHKEDDLRDQENKKVSTYSLVPYRELREELKNHKNTKELIAKLKQEHKQQDLYYSFIDFDVVDFNEIYSVYTDIYKYKTHKPTVMSTGYEFSDKAQHHISEVQVRSKSLIEIGKISRVVQCATAEIIPLGSYYPEPNFCVLLPNKDEYLRESFLKLKEKGKNEKDDGQTKESATLIRNIKTERKDITAIFSDRNPLLVEVPKRFAQNSQGKEFGDKDFREDILYENPTKWHITGNNLCKTSQVPFGKFWGESLYMNRPFMLKGKGSAGVLNGIGDTLLKHVTPSYKYGYVSPFSVENFKDLIGNFKGNIPPELLKQIQTKLQEVLNNKEDITKIIKAAKNVGLKVCKYLRDGLDHGDTDKVLASKVSATTEKYFKYPSLWVKEILQDITLFKEECCGKISKEKIKDARNSLSSLFDKHNPVSWLRELCDELDLDVDDKKGKPINWLQKFRDELESDVDNIKDEITEKFQNELNTCKRNLILIELGKLELFSKEGINFISHALYQIQEKLSKFILTNLDNSFKLFDLFSASEMLDYSNVYDELSEEAKKFVEQYYKELSDSFIKNIKVVDNHTYDIPFCDDLARFLNTADPEELEELLCETELSLKELLKKFLEISYYYHNDDYLAAMILNWLHFPEMRADIGRELPDLENIMGWNDEDNKVEDHEEYEYELPEDDTVSGNGSLKSEENYLHLTPLQLFYNKYYRHGLEEILSLRLKVAETSDTTILPIMRLSEQTLELILSQAVLKLEEGFDNVVVPLNIEGKHWAGLLVRVGAKSLEIEYLDSEQNGLSTAFKEQISSYFKGMDVNIIETSFERQKYNNCGPELVENFVKLLGGARVSQEAAPYLHSWLLEQKLIENAIEQAKPPDPVSIVKTLPQKSAIIPIENKLLLTNTESTTNQEKANYYTYSSSLSSVFTNLINKVLDKLDLSWQYKKVIYHQDITKFAQILKDNNIDKSVDVLKDHSELRKSVLIKLHPDKGGSNEDFAFVKGLEEKLSEQIDVDRLLREKIQQTQPYIYKAGLGFKALDAVVDVMRVLHEPTAMNAKKVAVDAAHLYGMHNGFNGFSMAISGFDSGYSFYQGNYSTAVQQLATTAFYMGLPKAMGYIGVPYLGFAYSAAMVAYSGYGALANLYSFYNEYNSEDSSLRSATAYKGILDFLEATPLKWLYDFSSNAKSYQVKINNLNLSNEKKILENKLKEEKGEFGEKLYKYIYKPLIEEKYELQNKVLQGEITEEEADILKSKQISITTEDKIYDHCMEIKNLSRNENSKEHYYCYDEKQEVLDHITILGSASEVLESL